MARAIVTLGAGTASAVRVSTTGALERCTPSVGDDIVGRCETDGYFHAAFGFVDPAWSTGGTSFTPPTGTGFATVTSGVLDTASRKVDLSSSTYVTNTLAVANGGTGIAAIATGMATFWATPTGANLATALTTALSLTKVGAPTGTGLAKVSGGAWSAASATLVDADVSASAALTVSKIAPSGTNGFVLKTVAGVTTWAAAGSGSAAGSTSGQVQTGDGVGGFLAPTNVLAGSGFVSIGASAAGSGSLRMTNAETISWRSGGSDVIALSVDASSRATLGDPAGDFMRVTPSGSDAGIRISGEFIFNIGAGQDLNFQSAGNTTLYLNGTTAIEAAQPITGHAMPWGVHGGVAITPPSDASYTLASSEYCYDWIALAKGAWASGHSIVLPAPASKAAGYYKTIFNQSTFTATISNGGTTKTLTTGLAQRFWFDVAGVNFAGATFTP